MAEYNPGDIIGRTFLLPANQRGEICRASNKEKGIEVSQKLHEDQATLDENNIVLLDVGQGRSQAIISYNQVWNYLKKNNQDDGTLYKLRAIMDHWTMMTLTTKEVSTM